MFEYGDKVSVKPYLIKFSDECYVVPYEDKDLVGMYLSDLGYYHQILLPKDSKFYQGMFLVTDDEIEKVN